MTSPAPESLFDRLGRAPGVQGVVDDLYALVQADPELAPHFHRTDMAAQRRKLAEMIGEAAGGPSAPWLLPLREAHAGRGITNRQFSLLAAHLADVLQQRGVGPDETDAVLEVVAHARPLVVDTDVDA